MADVVENALLSVVEIQTDAGYGTGFIINEDGSVITNRHVLQGASTVNLHLPAGMQYAGRLSAVHDSLDIAYLDLDTDIPLTPIAIGDSDTARVGDEVLVIGFPLASELGQEPTVSRGIVSARRGGFLETDAPVNPGNSGGPMLDQFGNVIGVITSRVDTSESGRPVTGIGFAIPINDAISGSSAPVSPSGSILPTPTPFPTIAPPPDLGATKTALDAIDAERRAIESQRQLEAQATHTALEAAQEAERYAASLEATRIAELPTPTPQPTPTPMPTPTPSSSSYCREWETMVLDWIYEGNNYRSPWGSLAANVPNHPQLSADLADDICIPAFPDGVLWTTHHHSESQTVGTGWGELLPGTYKYRAGTGDDRVTQDWEICWLAVNRSPDPDQTLATAIDLPYGEPFTLTFYTYHNNVKFDCYGSAGLYRTGA